MKKKIHSLFYRWGELVSARPKQFLLICLVSIVALASFLPHIVFDTSTEGFLPKNDKAIERYEAFKDQFGRDDFIILAIEHPNIFSRPFVSALRQLHEQMKLEVPLVSDVDSLINARRIVGDNDDLIVEDFFESESKDSTATYYQYKKQEALANPLYRRLFIDDQQRYTTLVLRLQNKRMNESGELVRLQEDELEPSITAVRKIADDWKNKHQEAKVYLAGSPVIVSKLKEAMMKDMRGFTLITLVIIASFLLFLFRRASGVSLPISVVVLSVLSTASAMAAFGAPIQLPTVILPSFILAVAVGDSVHFLTLFYQHFDHHPERTDLKEKSEAIAEAMAHTGTPMLLTSLTTAAGLASFSFAGVVPIANLGMFSALGVCIAFILTITLLPSLLIILPIKRKMISGSQSDKSRHVLDNTLIGFTNACIKLSAQLPKTIIIISLCFAAIAVYSASKLNFSHDPVVWLPDDWEIKQATQIVDERLRGTVSIEMLIDTGKSDGVKDPGFLKRLDKVNQAVASFKNENLEVRKVISIIDIIKESNQALHGNKQDFYSIPDEQNLIAQELFLLELSGADDLENLVDSNYQTARVTISIPWIDTIYYKDLLSFIVDEYRQGLGNKVTVNYTGIVPVLGNTLKAVITSAAFSYLLAFAVISLMLIIMLGSIRYGLLAMLPNIIPITLTLGLMQVSGAPLDMFTMLIASIALGLSVDDTIHFMHHFKENMSKGDSVNEAIENTLHTSGRAMLITSIVLCSGFIVYTFSEMNNLDTFGAFTAITIFMALLADFLLAPALMIVSHPKTR